MPTEEDFLSMEEEPAPGGFGLDGKGQMPSIEEILNMIETASGLSDEEKASIREDVLKFNAERDGLISNNVVTAATTAGGLLAPHNFLFLSLITLVVFIIGFLVYKLIKAERDKERAKEMKRKAREERRRKRKPDVKKA